MKKITTSALGVLMGIGMWTTASAATINVPADQPTIQDAVTAAAPGDTIVVAAGNYTENISVDKSLTFLGANQGVDGSAGRGAESNIRGFLKIDADDVVINGLKFTDGANIPGGDNAAIYIVGGHNQIAIQNSLFVRTGSAPAGFDGFRGILNEIGGVGSLDITNNKFTGWHTAVYLQTAGRSNIRNNTMENNMVGISCDGPNRVTVEGNQIINNAFEGIGVGSPLSVMDIQDNSIVGNGTYAGGSGVHNYDASATLNIENNWWGSFDGTLINVQGDVDAIPWLASPMAAHDTTAPDAPTIDTISGDNRINASEVNGIMVTGMSEPNSFVIVTLVTGANRITKTGASDAGGNYIVTVDGTLALPAALLDGNVTVSVQTQDQSGNVGVQRTANASQDSVFPTLPTVHIQSNGTDPAWAKVGDVLTLTFTASETILTPTVTIAGHAIVPTNVGANNWQATYTVVAGDNSSAFVISSTDLAGNTGGLVSATTDSSAVMVDTVSPVFSSIGVAATSNPGNPGYAKANSVLTFTMVLASPDSYIGGGKIHFKIGNSAVQTINFIEPASTTPANTYTATFDLSTFAAVDNQQITITGIDFRDAAANAMAAIAAQAPAPTVTIDTKAPTLSGASYTTSNTNPVWAKAGNTITYTLNFSENVIGSGNTSVASATTSLNKNSDLSVATFGQTGQMQFQVVNGNNGVIALSAGNYTLTDRAGNVGNFAFGAINGFVGGTIKADTTAPTITATKISSNNSFDSKLAKTNDTITVNFTSNDNLSPTVTLVNGATVLNKSITAQVIGAVGASSIARFTDGTETSEVVVPFSFQIRDEAGNVSLVRSATQDGSSVKFDRTNPVVQNVKISAASADNTAYLGDAPTYYAKKGDSITFGFQTCDYLDAGAQLLTTPSGTILGTAVTMTSVTSTSNGCTTPNNNPGYWHTWTTTVPNIDGVEGPVAFDIRVRDNAGNGDGTTNSEVHVTGTTDGSKVIFDKTKPVNPTYGNVVDREGLEIESFKGRMSAVFSWNDDYDPSGANGATGSGVWKYHVRYTNPTDAQPHRDEWTAAAWTIMNGGSKVWDGTKTDLEPWHTLGSGKIPPRDIDKHYQLNIQTRDKAGNDSAEELRYDQPYTVSIYGFAKDATGAPIQGTIVQVVSRFNEVCDMGKEICQATTSAAGYYSIVVNKDQDYNVTFYRPGYYLGKQDVNAGDSKNFYPDTNGIYDDVEQDIVLNVLPGLKQWQTFDQTIRIMTDAEFQVGDTGVLQKTEILVNTLSGQISATKIQDEDQIVITSLSRITSVVSNNPGVRITDNGNNTFTVFGGGNLIHTGSQTGTEANYEGGEHGYAYEYNSGDSKIGVIIIPSSGKADSRMAGEAREDHMSPRVGITEEESKADIARMNAGSPHKTLTYTNVNGYEIFKGYQSGKLAMDKLYQPKNKVKYMARGNVETFEKIEGSADGKVETIKSRLIAQSSVQDQMESVLNRVQPKNEVVNEKSQVVGLKKLRSGDEFRAAQNRNDLVKNKVNKFAIIRDISGVIPSRLEPTDQNFVKLKFNGKSVSMAQYLKGSRKAKNEDETAALHGTALLQSFWTSAWEMISSLWNGFMSWFQ